MCLTVELIHIFASLHVLILYIYYVRDRALYLSRMRHPPTKIEIMWSNYTLVHLLVGRY